MYRDPKKHWKAIAVATVLVALALWAIIGAMNPEDQDAPAESTTQSPTNQEETTENTPPQEQTLGSYIKEQKISGQFSSTEEKVAYVQQFLPMPQTIRESEFYITQKEAQIALFVDQESLDDWHAGLTEADAATVPDTLWQNVPMINIGFPDSVERKRFVSEDGKIKMLQIPEFWIVMIWME